MDDPETFTSDEREVEVRDDRVAGVLDALVESGVDLGAEAPEPIPFTEAEVIDLDEQMAEELRKLFENES